jgi:hypothetical protein
MNSLINSDSSTTANINNLQTIETQLQQNLEMGLAQGNLTENEINTTINQINSIASMRMNLYDSMGSNNQFYQSNLKMANDTLNQQTQVLDILETKLNDNRKKIIALAENKNNNIRLAEINSYYSEKYKAQARFMKIVIILILPVLISAILVKRNLIPYVVFKYISVIIGVISFFFLINQLYFFSTRNNMVYQEYNAKFKNTPNSSSTSFGDSSGNDISGNDISGNDPWFANSYLCEGSNCCSSGMTFNTGLNQCVESFQMLHPATTPSLSSLSSTNPLPISTQVPVPVLGDINKTDDPLISKDLDYNHYKNSTNNNSKNTSTWDNIFSSLDQLISNKKADYTMGMNSLSGYNS